ncbi:MAG TPA: S8 family serine peptidase [Cellvibrionaceae bacterium]
MNRTAAVCLTLLLSFSLPSAATAVDAKNNNNKQPNISYKADHKHNHFAERDQRYRDANEPMRVIVRLQGEALAPFLKQQHAKMAGAASKPTDQEREQHAKTIMGQQEKLRHQQKQLLSKLQQNQLIHSVHAQFVTATHALSVTVKAGDINTIRQLPGVAGVYPEQRYQTTLAESLEQVRAPDAWLLMDNQGQTLTGKGIHVGILDTGIDYTHPDLGGCVGDNCKVRDGVNFTTPLSSDPEDEMPDYDTVIADDDFMDRNGHGTHVAGTVAAKGAVMGVAPDAYLYAIKVLSDEGWGSTSGIIAGIEWAMDPDGDPLTDDQLDVINMSLGGGFDPIMNEAVDAATEAGIVVVVAAGNIPGYEMLGSPAAAEQAITVGAIDKQDQMAVFTSRGPLREGNVVKPELVAPGVSINSTWINNSHRVISGTSMAAPHVAGAAAILRQLHPSLSISEVKALLVGQARDLGEDIFTQGSGALDLLASAEASWLLDPAVLYWGRYGPNTDSETLSTSIHLRNLSQTALNFNGAIGGETIIGTALTLETADLSPLSPNEVRELSLSLAIDQSLVPISERTSLHHEGTGGFTVEGEAQRIPQALIKAAVIDITMAQGLEYLLLFGEDSDYQRLLAPINCEGEPEQRRVYLKPGRYQSFWRYADEPCTAPDKIMFADTLVLDTSLEVTTPELAAPLEVGLGHITDAQQNPVDTESLSLDNLCYTIWHPQMSDIYFSCGSLVTEDRQRLIFFNTMPEGYQLDYSLLLSENNDTGFNIYFLSDHLHGQDTSHLASLDLTEAGKLSLIFADTRWNNASVGFSATLNKSLGINGNTGVDVNQGDLGTLHLPLPVNLYAPLTTLNLSEWYVGINIKGHHEIPAADEDDDPFYGLLQKPDFSTGPMGFVSADDWFKIGSFDEQLEILHAAQGDMVITQSGYYFSAQVMASPNLTGIETFTEAGPFSGLQKDERHNRLSGSMPYRIHCEGQILSEGNFRQTFFADFMPPEQDCSELYVDVTMTTQIPGHSDSSELQVHFVRQPAESLEEIIGPDARNDWMAAPWLKELSLLDDGEVSRHLVSDNPGLRLRFNQQPGIAALTSLTLGYRLNDSEEWQTLETELAEGNYTASLPVLPGSQRVSLRIEAVNEHGHSMRQILNSIFYLGTDTELNPQIPPFFQDIPSFTLEATGPLTSLDIFDFDLFAYELGGAEVAAERQGDSLLGLGVHEIIWTAVGSNGVEAFATQQVEIIDTTAPVITAPANSRVEVASGGTTENPAHATAVDLVDGEVPVVADKTGPFAEGTHTVTWTASDLSANTATALQTLTVITPTTTDGSTETGGNSSGGGSVSFWSWLLLMMGYLFNCGRSSRLYSHIKCYRHAPPDQFSGEP